MLSSDQEFNLGRAMQKVAQDYPDFPAILSPEAIVTYADLFATTVSIAREMQARGVGRGSLVALNTGDTVVSLATLLATALLGSRFIVAGMVVARQKVLEPTHFFRTPDAKGKAGVDFVEIDVRWLPQVAVDPGAVLPEFAGYSDAEADWLYLYTSGTTGNPKGIALSQGVVYRRSLAVAEDFPLASTTMAALFSNTSRPFYARALAALLRACTIVDSPDPAFWTKAGVDVVFGSPRQFERFLEVQTVSPAVARVEVSGAKLGDELAVTLSRSFSHITDVYGASETSKSFANIVEVAADGAVSRYGKRLDSTVEIVDEEGRVCAGGVAGIVRVKNAYMAPGYVASPRATAKSFRDGWFYPGDTAMWAPTGELQVIGRTDDVLSFGGLKLDAALVDLVIRLTPGVEDAICFKNPKRGKTNEITAFVVFDKLVDRINCVEAIRANYQLQLKLPCFLGRIHAIDRIPRTEEGKPMRSLCQDMILNKVEGVGEAFD
jgi:acyl-coenzyme A synthetase/AMP-(fatty) acid ligase